LNIAAVNKVFNFTLPETTSFGVMYDSAPNFLAFSRTLAALFK